MKKLLVNLQVSKIIYVCIVLCNLFLPIYYGKVLNINAFQFAIIIIWTVGLVSHLGYLKTQVSSTEDGIVKYETITPILPIGMTRIAQVIYYVIRKPPIRWSCFVGLMIADVLYIAFLLWDKANYYYESEMNEND